MSFCGSKCDWYDTTKNMQQVECEKCLHEMHGEYILCSAIWFDDGKEYAGTPYNIESGIVFCGWRHGNIFPQVGGTVTDRQAIGLFEKEQGFITNLNRFVGREEAGAIAYKAGQIDKPNNHLFSEDLY